MQLTKLNLLVIALIVGAIGYGTGRFMTPEKIVEVEKVVEKETTKKETTNRTTKKPDGTVIEETITKDETTTESSSEHSVAIDNKKPDWFIAGGYGLNKTAYSAEANRRIMGPLFVGIQATYTPEDKVTGLVKIGYEF